MFLGSVGAQKTVKEKYKLKRNHKEMLPLVLGKGRKMYSKAKPIWWDTGYILVKTEMLSLHHCLLTTEAISQAKLDNQIRFTGRVELLQC